MAKTKPKLYAVAAGRKPGIYTEWFGPGGAEAQIRGVAGARYKGFSTRDEAERWLKNPGSPERTAQPVPADVPEKPRDLEGHVLIYTDGASLGNPGPGGYGIVMINGDERLELSGGFRRTTNNRMELMGCIVALSRLEEPAHVLLRTDSQYVVNGIMKGWAKRWRKNGWMRTPNDAAENSDLWKQLLELTERHTVIFEWVRGHAGHDENERCDELAGAMAAQEGLPPDTNYEQRRTSVLPPLF